MTTKSNDGMICGSSADTAAYWLRAVKSLSGFKPEDEGVFVICLGNGGSGGSATCNGGSATGERRFAGCHRVVSRFFRSPVLFADEVVKAECLAGVEEFILFHNRPGIEPVADVDSKARARALILAARLTTCSLLDYIVRGVPTEKSRLGIVSLCRLKGFNQDDPFPERGKT